MLIRLHSAPMYFYKKGRGRYKAAPPKALEAALASQEKDAARRNSRRAICDYWANSRYRKNSSRRYPACFIVPTRIQSSGKRLKPLVPASKLSVSQLLEKCGAIPSTHDYHLNRFLLEHFPEGTEFEAFDAGICIVPADLPIADVAAFSIDDVTTTEIDDAFSVTPLTLGSVRIGIHIAVPTLGIAPGSPMDALAAERLSTVYIPGQKITMFPDAVIQHYTLCEKRLCPVVSMYLDVADDFTVFATSSRIEQVRIAANLRHDTLEEHFNESTLAGGKLDHPFGKELLSLWNFACKAEALRGKANDSNNERIDYCFSVKDDRIDISQRRRGSPD